jgi:hypothetical protein
MYRERFFVSGKNECVEITLIDCNKAEMTLKGNSE